MEVAAFSLRAGTGAYWPMPEFPTTSEDATNAVVGFAVGTVAAIQPPTVHIIEDDELVGRMLCAMLAAADIACRTYGSSMEFLEIAADIGPGCIITDLLMPQIDGIELIGRLAEMGVRRPIIVISGRGGIAAAVLAMKAGARDFIEKPLRRQALLNVVTAAIEADARAAEPEAPEPVADDLVSVLSPREQTILRAVVAGRGNKVIAYELGISPRTVETHRANVMMKTRARSLSELVRRAYQAGIEG
jgi:two-component system response regulator FixJ